MTKVSQLIIDTAGALFYQKEFNAVGVDTIKDEAKCSKMSLYNHFGSKANLIIEVLKNCDKSFRGDF